MHNVTRNIAKFKVDAATGRALLLVAHSSDPRYEEAEGDFSHRRDDSEGLIKQLTTATFAGYVRAHRLALVAYGAPWCPYSRRLAPVWDEIATVIGFSDDVRLGRVDCTEPEAEALCSAAHINACASRVGWWRVVWARCRGIDGRGCAAAPLPLAPTSLSRPHDSAVQGRQPALGH